MFNCVSVRYVFHSAGIFPDPSYQSRVKYLGQSGTKNCSLRINDLKQTDTGTYVFYLITNHPTEKMPAQTGIQLLVTGENIDIYHQNISQTEHEVEKLKSMIYFQHN